MDYCKHYLNLVYGFIANNDLGADALTEDRLLSIDYSERISLLLGIWEDRYLFVEAAVVLPDAAQQLKLYQQALTANWLGDTLAGAKFCLNPETGFLTLVTIRPAQEIANEAQLADWLKDLGEVALTWLEQTERNETQTAVATPAADRSREWMRNAGPRVFA